MVLIPRQRWTAVLLLLCIASGGCRMPRPLTTQTYQPEYPSQTEPSSSDPSGSSSAATGRSRSPQANSNAGSAHRNPAFVDTTEHRSTSGNSVQLVSATTDAVEVQAIGDPADTGLSSAAVDSQIINLPTALMLTAGRSPEVSFAMARIAESRAQLDRAETLWLPSLRAGVNYNKHEGRIQDVAGTVIETSRGSLYSGLGAGAVGAGSPAVPGVLAHFHVTDAVFQPRIAQQTVQARNASHRATRNDRLLATALSYVTLLKSTQDRAVAEMALTQTQELERVTREFAAAGQGLTSDHDRARTELALRKNELQRTDEAVLMASAALVQQVRWEYARTLRPEEEALYPIDLVDLETPAQGLVALGLSNRPEITESRHLICEAVERLNRERYAPLIPSVLLGVSYGGLTGGLGGDLINSGDRLDADAMAYWELRQLGYGEQAAQREAQSRITQTRMRQVALMDQVAREIVEAHAQIRSRSHQIASAGEAVSAAEDSFQRNWDRIQNGQGLPIEVLQSIQALTISQREYTRSIADYNTAQFTLHRALGWPIQMTERIPAPAN
jgi:outer membrane protein TolC